MPATLATQDAEAGGVEGCGQPNSLSKTLSQNQNKKHAAALRTRIYSLVLKTKLPQSPKRTKPPQLSTMTGQDACVRLAGEWRGRADRVPGRELYNISLLQLP